MPGFDMVPAGHDVIVVQRHSTPAGEMLIASFGHEICLCDWVDNPRRDLTDRRLTRVLGTRFTEGSSEAIVKTISQIDEYFEGERTLFDITVRLVGTPFQCRVWETLAAIPYGTTLSYGALARHLGNSNGVRAVAGAVASNPVSIILPCHRVIADDGRVGGYAGGAAAKQMLLALERRVATTQL